MANDNIDDWQEVPTSPGTAQAVPSTDPNDPGDWIEQSRIPKDEITGEDLPIAFSGLSPETAMNKSVVSGIERLKMSVGNTAGNIDYLKKKFEDVRLMKDADGNDTSEIAVLKQGSWYRVDPVNGELPDAWEKSKEFLRDTADAGAVLGGVAAGIGAAVAAPVVLPALGVATVAGASGVAAGAGFAAAVGAGIGATRTSLGRILGTYEATPMEQLFDVSFEALLNASGAKVAAGVKPTASWVANHIDDLAKAFGDTLEQPGVAGSVARGAKATVEAPVNTSKALLKRFFAAGNVGVDNFDTMLQYPQQVKAMMKNAFAKSGSNSAAYHDDITGMQRQQIANFADNARKTLTQIYGQASNKILSMVDPNFSANFDEPIMEAYRGALSKGLAKIQVGDDVFYGAEAVKWLDDNGLAAMKSYAPHVAKAGPGKGIPGEVGDILMSKTKVSAPKFSLLSPAEMKAAIREGQELADDIGYLSTNPEAHAAVSNFYDELGGFAGAIKGKGAEAAKSLLNFKRVASDKAYALAHQDHVARMPGVKRLLDVARSQMDDSVYQSLNKSGKGAGREFQQLNKLYSSLQTEMSPILRAREQSIRSGDFQPYEAMLNRFLARPGKNVTSKFAIDASIEAAEAHGLKNLAAELTAQKTAIQVGEAAKAFNPLQSAIRKSEFVTKGVFAAGAAISGNPLFLGMAATGIALRSPMTARAGAAGVNAITQAQQLLSSMPAKQVAQFISRPETVQPFLTGISAAPMIYENTRQALEGQVQQLIGGQGQ